MKHLHRSTELQQHNVNRLLRFYDEIGKVETIQSAPRVTRERVHVSRDVDVIIIRFRRKHVLFTASPVTSSSFFACAPAGGSPGRQLSGGQLQKRWELGDNVFSCWLKVWSSLPRPGGGGRKLVGVLRKSASPRHHQGGGRVRIHARPRPTSLGGGVRRWPRRLQA